MTIEEIMRLAEQDPPRKLEFRPRNLEPILELEKLFAGCVRETEEWARRPKPEPGRQRNDPIDVQAVARVVGPHYAPGQRHYVALGLAGYLAKQGVAQNQAEAVMAMIASADDDGGTKAGYRIVDTYENHAADRKSVV